MPTRPPVHRPFVGETKFIRARRHDQHRGSARARGYTAEWDAAAKDHLRLHPLCVGCEAIGLVVEAQLVDHVEPHKGDTVKFWNRAMWQSSCRWHHNVVKARLEAMFAKGQIGIKELWLSSTAAISLTLSMRGCR